MVVRISGARVLYQWLHSLKMFIFFTCYYHSWMESSWHEMSITLFFSSFKILKMSGKSLLKITLAARESWHMVHLLLLLSSRDQFTGRTVFCTGVHIWGVVHWLHTVLLSPDTIPLLSDLLSSFLLGKYLFFSFFILLSHLPTYHPF